MRRDSTDIKGLENLLNKYRFTDPVSPDIQKRMIRSKKEIFVRVLKTVGRFSAVIGIFQSLYFLLKKLGINIFTAKFILYVATAGIISGGAYTAVKYLDDGTAPDKKIEMIDGGRALPSVPEIQKVKVTRKSAPVKNYTLGITEFSGESAGPDAAERLSTALTGRLSALKGDSYAGLFSGGGAKGVRYSLFGSVEYLNGKYILHIKVVDLETSSIVLLEKMDADSVEKLEKKLGPLADKIIKKLE